MKDTQCEFLHKLDKDKMPDCDRGAKCPNKDNGLCDFVHAEADLTCAFFAHVPPPPPSP